MLGFRPAAGPKTPPSFSGRLYRRCPTGCLTSPAVLSSSRPDRRCQPSWRGHGPMPACATGSATGAIQVRGVWTRPRAPELTGGPRRSPSARWSSTCCSICSQPRPCRQPRRPARRGLGRPDRLGIDPDQPHQRRAQRDRRYRRRPAPDPHRAAQGLPLRRRRHRENGAPADRVHAKNSWSTQARAPTAPRLPDKPSIAVLPFPI